MDDPQLRADHVDHHEPAVVWVIVLAPQLDTTFGGNEQLFVHAVAGVTTWTGWVIPLLISQWWLERRRHTIRPETSNRVSIAAT